MLCFKIHRRIFGSILFAVFFSALLYLPSYAINDYSGSFDASTFPFVLCYGSDSPDSSPQCSDYNTILFNITSPVSSNSPLRYFQVTNSSNSAIYTINTSVDSSLDISSLPATAQLSIINQYSFGSARFDYTLTNTSSCPPSPSGSISITENGTFDVSSYSTAIVDVPIPPGDYHDDLIKITNGIYVCAGTLLVLYFLLSLLSIPSIPSLPSLHSLPISIH